MVSQQFHLGDIKDFFLNALFPRFCLSCGQEGDIVCARCASEFDDVLTWDGGEHFASFAYGNALIHDLIKAWKYDYDQSAFEYLKRFAEPTIKDIKAMIEQANVEAVGFVPLSPKRERERGFNQARMIAGWIGQTCDRPVVDLLSRRETKGHQAERTDEERKAAMSNSPFSFKGEKHKKSVLIVDDVWTTGSTLLAAQTALKDGGVERVVFYTLAKGR